jgi:predicted ATPase/class 3 adenylate cyclase/Tfp pilus assembly protein PilF
MLGLPTGTVTFLFTDIEGSTQLLERVGDDRYAEALTAHQSLLRAAFAQQHGYEIDTKGDSFFVVFQRAGQAVSAAVAAQLAIAAHTWPEGGAVRVRMGLHTGTPMVSVGEYVGLDVHRAARICAAAHGDQILVSQETGRVVEAELPPEASLRDLGSHLLKDLQQPEKVFQVLHPALPADFPPLKSLDEFANNLPRQLTSFIGREREIAQVKRLLRTTCLLTVTGTGGAGKTRLALQIAREVLEEYPDGVWLVELAALTDPSLVPQTVAKSLRVREVPGRPVEETLLHYLQRKRLLLVLDNCEHLITACARLAEAILRSCPRLRVLATSREVLGVAGEISWRVPSLSLPDPHQVPQLARLTQFEAVRLFVERASAAQPTFSLTAANAASLATVVRRLDGIPLAIELAAARVPVLSVEQIAARLDDRFRLLTGGSRTSLPRHQTLRAALDWSYQLLTQIERLAIHRLSVFVGGWTLEAAEAVCAGSEIEPLAVLDLLTQLVFKSLVLMDEQAGEVRYRFLETVRQYGLDKLLGSEEANTVRRRHRDFFLALVERTKPELTGPDQAVWLDRSETEHDNFRTALEWSLAAGDAESGMRLAGGLARFWAVRGYISEGRERLSRVLSRAGTAEQTAARGEALIGAGILALRQGEYSEARALFYGSLKIQRALGDKAGIAQTLNNLGLAARKQGDYAEARALHEESLAIRRELGYKLGIASALNNLGLVAGEQGDYGKAGAFLRESLAMMRDLGYKMGIAIVLDSLGLVATAQGNYGRARAFSEESLAISRELGTKGGNIAYALNNLGIMASREGDYATARALLEESLSAGRASGDKSGIAYALHTLGNVVHRQGDDAAALALQEESLAIRRQLGDKLGIAQCLEALAWLAAAKGEGEAAAKLLGAAEALREAIGAPLPPSDSADHQHHVAEARALSGVNAFSAAWDQGRRMPLEQAIKHALQFAAA